MELSFVFTITYIGEADRREGTTWPNDRARCRCRGRNSLGTKAGQSGKVLWDKVARLRRGSSPFPGLSSQLKTLGL